MIYHNYSSFLYISVHFLCLLNRYSWNGRPLYITSPSEGSIIPACPYCSGARVFEVQLMPPLISVLKTTTPSGKNLNSTLLLVDHVSQCTQIDTRLHRPPISPRHPQQMLWCPDMCSCCGALCKTQGLNGGGRG